MIYIYTGTPGAGKTMCLVSEAVIRGEREKRPVYVSGIPGLSGEGIFDLENPADWMACPDGSIIIIDEAQRVFPSRLAKVQVPDCIAAMETHRHRGIDIYLATQSINMLDVHLRRLCNVHRHLVRVFGLRASTIYEWDEACDDTRDKQARRLSRKSRFKFSKAYYSRYKSTTIDTAQRRLPWLLKWGAPVIVAAVVGAIYGIHAEFAGMARHFQARALAKPIVLRGVPHSSAVRVSDRRVSPEMVAFGRRVTGWRIGGTIRAGSDSQVILLHEGNVEMVPRSRCVGRREFLRCKLPNGSWVWI